MSALLLLGKPVADQLLRKLKPEIKKLNPKLVIVQVGDDPASASYIRQKLSSCEAVGLRHEHKHLNEQTTLKELMRLIGDLNADDDVTGFILQLPLPTHLKSCLPQIVRAINPKKDIDSFGAYNLGKMFLSTEFEHLPPATPAGIIALLEHYKIPVEGKHAVVVGHSNTVGKPLAIMLLNRNATVTVCHIKTKDLAHHTLQADLLFVAVGKPGLITKDMVKKGAVVIEIGAIPATEIPKQIGCEVDEKGFLKVSANQQTSVPGVFGAGDITTASNFFAQFTTAAGEGAVAANSVFNFVSTVGSKVPV